MFLWDHSWPRIWAPPFLLGWLPWKHSCPLSRMDHLRRVLNSSPTSGRPRLTASISAWRSECRVGGISIFYVISCVWVCIVSMLTTHILFITVYIYSWQTSYHFSCDSRQYVLHTVFTLFQVNPCQNHTLLALPTSRWVWQCG